MSTTIQPPVSAPVSGPDQPASRPDAADAPDLVTVLDPRDGALVGRLEPTGRAGIRAAVEAAGMGIFDAETFGPVAAVPAAPRIPA